MRQGDRVATIAPNTHAQLESFYAVPQLGAVLVPMNYRLTPDDFVYMVNHSGSTVLCVHSDYLDAIDGVRDQMPGVRHFVAFEGAGDGWLDYEALVAATEPAFSKPEIGERDLLTINYTSGTTSRPKGVMITHRNAAMNTIGTLLHLPMGVGDRYLWTLPMFHANGWTFTWTVTAAAGTHVCLRKVDPALVFSLIRDERVGWLCAAPDRADLAGQRARARCGARCRPGCAWSPRARRPPRRRSSGSRASSAGTSRRSTGSPRPRRSSPCARRCPSTRTSPPPSARSSRPGQGVELLTSGELRVVDDLGAEVPADGVTLGEITVRGNVVMDGYYNDPEATKKAMGDGWFHTGDAAVVHPDGYVEIRDRIKDVIISGGENISSVEVEGALLRHPAVGEAAVVGLPSEQWGETPHAFVVLMPGAVGDGGRADRLRQGPDRALQGAARHHLRDRPAQDRDRQDPEVRPARRRRQPLEAVISRGATRPMSARPGLIARTAIHQAQRTDKSCGTCTVSEADPACADLVIVEVKGTFRLGGSSEGGGVGYGRCGRVGLASGRRHRAQGGQARRQGHGRDRPEPAQGRTGSARPGGREAGPLPGARARADLAGQRRPRVLVLRGDLLRRGDRGRGGGQPARSRTRCSCSPAPAS